MSDSPPQQPQSTESQEEDGSEGLIAISGMYNIELDELKELFPTSDPLAEAARFAMAIGILNGGRVLRAEWGKEKRRNIAQFGQFAKKFDLTTLFDLLELKPPGDDTPLNFVIAEYITGGLQWIRDNEIHKGTNFSEIKEAFPDLFNE